jgi:cation-transporting ATPase E
MKQEWEAQSVVPFSSEKKWSMVSFHGSDYILGAPEKLLGDNYAKFEVDFKEELNNGARIVAFGEKINEEFKLLGIIILQDEIRENAVDTIKYFIEQGVDLKVISGDNALTTSVVAGKAGIKNADKYCDVLTLEPEEINNAIEKYTVFGRVTPEFKLAFVKALQSKGHIVAMTGDGINDVMALKEADCSIAMQSGSDAARNVSSLVLLDSDFAHLPEIVSEGRRSINNLERSSVLYLTKTIYAILLAFTFLFINYNYPFQPIQYTLIGAVAIGIPSFILAFEPNEDRVKPGYLFHVLKNALPGGLLISTNIWLTVLMVYLRTGSETSVATMVTCSTGIASLMFLYDLCKPLNAFRAALVTVLSVIFTCAIIFAPGFFETLGYTFMRLVGLLLIAVVDYFIFMLYKKIILQKFTMQKFSSIIEKKFRLGGRRNGQN